MVEGKIVERLVEQYRAIIGSSLQERRNGGVGEIDYKLLFESVAGLCLVLRPNFIIVAVSDAYLRATMTVRESILGRGLFEVFPDSPNDPNASGAHYLNASLQRVLFTRAADSMPVQKYDRQRPAEEGGGFEERFWSRTNSPVFGRGGELLFIIHRVEDVTEFVNLQRTVSQKAAETEEMRVKMSRADREEFQRSIEVAEAHEKSQEAIAELRSVCFSLSHDFRAPIRAIHSFAEIVLKEQDGKLDASAVEYLQKCVESAGRMDEMIQKVAAVADPSAPMGVRQEFSFELREAL